MSEAKFKTMRHIETVRNYLNKVVRELLHRQEQHDQSKLQPPEVDTFEIYTHKLRGMTYGSDEYRQCLAEMKPAIDHHNAHNRHHPEHFKSYYECDNCAKDLDADMNHHNGAKHINQPCVKCGCITATLVEGGVQRMNLIDLVEMLVDWKAAGMRHDDGNLMRSIDINQKRFGYSDELADIFRNTAKWLNDQDVYHRADES